MVVNVRKIATAVVAWPRCNCEPNKSHFLSLHDLLYFPHIGYKDCASIMHQDLKLCQQPKCLYTADCPKTLARMFPCNTNIFGNLTENERAARGFQTVEEATDLEAVSSLLYLESTSQMKPLATVARHWLAKFGHRFF
jgi:hypothetical protein